MYVLHYIITLINSPFSALQLQLLQHRQHRVAAVGYVAHHREVHPLRARNCSPGQARRGSQTGEA